MKKIIFLAILSAALLLSACYSQSAGYLTAEDYVLTQDTEAEEAAATPTPVSYIHYPQVSASTPEYPPDEDTDTPIKIAVITTSRLAAAAPQSGNWLQTLTERHPDNVLVYTWPRMGANATAFETEAMINEIAQNPAIRVLIINPAQYGTDHIVGILRQRRDDIFVVYLDYQVTNMDVEVNRPFRGNTLSYALSYADLILDFNTDAMARAFPAKAYELGARTLVYFYDSSIVWIWGEDGIIFNEYEKSDRRVMMRDKSAAIGLNFVGVDVAGAMQCGSSTQHFMAETLPPLIDQHGTDTVFFGLCNERTFWFWLNLGMVYLPTYSSWFQPCPEDIAGSLLPMDVFVGATQGRFDVECLIQEAQAALEERSISGRLASWPMSTRLLFPLAAAEYGMRWAQGDVPSQGIDMDILEEIMAGLIAEYTGTVHGVSLKNLIYDDVVHDNYVLVLLDYFVYQ